MKRSQKLLLIALLLVLPAACSSSDNPPAGTPAPASTPAPATPAPSTPAAAPDSTPAAPPAATPTMSSAKSADKPAAKAPAPDNNDFAKKMNLKPGTYAQFSTSLGDFVVEFYTKQAPKTVDNFIALAQGTKANAMNPKTNKSAKGMHYYDGITFHRVMDGFMIQSGDPLGTGTGGPGYTVPDEKSELVFDKEGILAMANTGRPNSGGAQFFVTLAPKSFLNGGYTIFGHVVDGMDVVHKIGKVPTKIGPSGEKSKPVTDVILKKVTIAKVKEG